MPVDDVPARYVLRSRPGLGPKTGPQKSEEVAPARGAEKGAGSAEFPHTQFQQQVLSLVAAGPQGPERGLPREARYGSSGVPAKPAPWPPWPRGRQRVAAVVLSPRTLSDD